MGQIIQKGVLGETVRNFAIEKDISISTLEKKAGYSPGMVSRWIAAGSEDYCSLSKLVTLADLLDVSLDELVSRQQETVLEGRSHTPVLRLMDETRSGQLVWWAWQPKDDGLVPERESGRPCCGGWQTKRDNLEFFLALFCDDIDDEDELMELTLYCAPGHKLPLFPIPNASLAELSTLYTQILLVDAFATHRERTASTVLSLDVQGNRTVAFRRSNG